MSKLHTGQFTLAVTVNKTGDQVRNGNLRGVPEPGRSARRPKRASPNFPVGFEFDSGHAELTTPGTTDAGGDGRKPRGVTNHT
jgi:hypothetical protein